jgi:hypothetical protein
MVKRPEVETETEKLTKGMVRCTLVQVLGLCTYRTARKGSRGLALLFLDHGTIRGWGVSVTHRPLFTPGKDPVPIVQEAGWAPGPVRTRAEDLVPTGIRSPDRPSRRQSLYRLSYWARRETNSLRKQLGKLKHVFLASPMAGHDNFQVVPSQSDRNKYGYSLYETYWGEAVCYNYGSVSLLQNTVQLCNWGQEMA